MVVRASSNNIYDYFRIGGYNIVPALCVANPFHKEVYDRGITQGQLITFQGTSSRTFRAVDVSSLMMNGRSVLDQLVSVYATELRSTVFPLVAGAERKMPGPLTNAYLLNSALSYVEIEDKNGVSGFFATKSHMIYEAMSDYRTVASRRQKPNSFYDQLNLAYAELNSNIFDVLKVTGDRDGYKVSKYKLNLNKPGITILPMYCIANYIDAIIAKLMNHRALITYLDGRVESKLMTSLRTDVLAYWLGTSDPGVVLQAQNVWQNPFLFGELTFPDLKSPYQYVTLQALKIKDIQILQ